MEIYKTVRDEIDSLPLKSCTYIFINLKCFCCYLRYWIKLEFCQYPFILLFRTYFNRYQKNKTIISWPLVLSNGINVIFSEVSSLRNHVQFSFLKIVKIFEYNKYDYTNGQLLTGKNPCTIFYRFRYHHTVYHYIGRAAYRRWTKFSNELQMVELS